MAAFDVKHSYAPLSIMILLPVAVFRYCDGISFYCVPYRGAGVRRQPLYRQGRPRRVDARIPDYV